MPSNKALVDILEIRPSQQSSIISIVSSQKSQRLDAALKFIVEIGLQCRFELINNPSLAKSKYIVYYGVPAHGGGFTVPNSGFLFESKLNNFEPEIKTMHGMPVLFPVSDTDFDLFSAAFYLVSRYEEWLPYLADEHGRFEAHCSFLNKHDLLHLPLAEMWLQNFKQQLLKFYPDIPLTDRRFRTISTIDIDNLYAYKGKGLKRTIGAAIRDIIHLNFFGFNERIQVLLNRKKDPFDVYEEVSDFCFENKIPLVCFFLMRSGTHYDRSVHPTSDFFKNAILSLKKNMAFIGLHPSYYSSTRTNLLKEEIEFLKQAGVNEVSLSRQHYLRGKVSQMPKTLHSAGIELDFSMGFASKAGFRAGTSLPFYYYNFDTECLTNLVIVPFCAMDGVWSEYGTKSTIIAEKELKSLIAELKKVNGLFISVYHERSFSNHLYKGFGSLYKKLFSELINTK